IGTCGIRRIKLGTELKRDLLSLHLGTGEQFQIDYVFYRQITFEFRSELDTPYPASANPIRQIILNLLLNAAEAAPEGGHVSFLATLNEGALQIVVTDDGPGMPEEALSVVTQAQENDVPQSGRLGLWLIHKLLDDIDARIEINTKSGKGTTVSISVPPRQQDIEA
ncbi:MAG: ATP-binding protein, partial [Pseudomonadota bacterium]